MSNPCRTHYCLLLFSLFLLSSLIVTPGCRNTAAVSNHQSATQKASTPVTGQVVNGIAFEEVATSSGLNFQWPIQKKPMRNLEAFGCGAAFLDYDNDGWLDILLVNKPTAALFRNQGNGTFKDVTKTTGLDGSRGDWKGCAVGDYNGDGFLDVLLTGYHCLALLKNQHGVRWANVTRAAGFDPQDRGHWGSSAGFMDLDGNGTLDLVICHYVVFGPKEKQFCEFGGGIVSGCPPATYKPEFPELWQNQGNGTFKDVTGGSGLKNVQGKSLVLAFADVDNDKRIDFYIGNDGTPAELMHNLGGLRFRNLGISSGVAFGMMPGRAIAAMGSDWADYDADGRLDLIVTAFSDEAYSLLRNRGNNLFEHVGDRTGISGATLKPLGFGAKWVDVDNDSWPDIVFANGHVYDQADFIDPLSPWRQPLMLFHNVPLDQASGQKQSAGKTQQRKFLDIAPKLGGGWTKPILGRGSAAGDYDNDGRMDILVVDYEGEPLLLHNVSQTPNHWIKLDLRSQSKNKFAYGARIMARSGPRKWIADLSPASSYLSSSDRRIHLGLGNVTSLDEIIVRWPDGKRQVLRSVHVDRILTINQGQEITE